MMFQDFYFFFLMTNNTIIFFILAFLVIENILILFHHSFHVSQEKTNWYNLTNFCLLAKVNKSTTKVSTLQIFVVIFFISHEF